MKYKDVIHFICDCLILSIDSNRVEQIREQIKSQKVDWERVVEVSSNHLVLPALYAQLKQSELLQYLPQDLQVYMGHITSVNRKRNQQNLQEVEEINRLLNLNGIEPIYLKGTAHLLEGLYLDDAERMVGDIDLLVAPELMVKAAELLMKSGYEPIGMYNSKHFEYTKHYPRLVHKEKIFAVEIHKDVIRNISDRQLDFKRINTFKRRVNGYYLPSYADLILHNIMNTQLNDQGFLLMNINLRQKYDLLLLSQYEKPIVANENFQFHQLTLNSYLVKSACMFRGVKALAYPKNIWTNWVVLLMWLKLKFPNQFRNITRGNYLMYRMYRDFSLAIRYLMDKESRYKILRYVYESECRCQYFDTIYSKLRSF